MRGYHLVIDTQILNTSCKEPSGKNILVRTEPCFQAAVSSGFGFSGMSCERGIRVKGTVTIRQTYLYIDYCKLEAWWILIIR